MATAVGTIPRQVLESMGNVLDFLCISSVIMNVSFIVVLIKGVGPTVFHKKEWPT